MEEKKNLLRKQPKKDKVGSRGSSGGAAVAVLWKTQSFGDVFVPVEESPTLVDYRAASMSRLICVLLSIPWVDLSIDHCSTQNRREI